MLLHVAVSRKERLCNKVNADHGSPVRRASVVIQSHSRWARLADEFTAHHLTTEVRDGLDALATYVDVCSVVAVDSAITLLAAPSRVAKKASIALVLRFGAFWVYLL